MLHRALDKGAEDIPAIMRIQIQRDCLLVAIKREPRKTALEARHTVLGISRSTNESLQSRASTTGATLEQWPRDLAHAPSRGSR